MKKTDLYRVIGEDLGCWEIANAGYEEENKVLNLVLLEYEWKGIPFGRDYKSFTGNIKNIKLIDEFAFSYLEDGVYVNSARKYVQNIGGLNLTAIDYFLKNPENTFTTEIQFDWINILKRLKIFDETKYRKILLESVKEEMVEYYSKNNNAKEFKKVLQFFNDLGNKIEK